MTTCPHCGDEHATGAFCPACGNRVAGRARGMLLRRILLALAMLCAAALGLAGATLGLCGGVVTIAGLSDPYLLGALLIAGPVMIAIGVVIWKLGFRFLRAGHASTTGDRTRRFGRPRKR